MATLVAPDHCDPFVDAEALRKACQGWGTDEKGIIEVICHRNAAQRKVIKETYEQQYSENLIKRLEDELSGDFERAVYRWMLEPYEREAVLANVALKKSDYKVIIELSCTPSAEELLLFKRAYQARYLHSLEEDVASYFTGDMRKLLLLLVSVHRHESEVTDPKLAETEAEILHNCIKDKEYNHDEIVRILTTRSKSQLIATFYQFRDAHGSPITKSLAGDKDQDFVSALHTVIRCIKSPIKYLERVLSHAMHTRGTDEDAITRVLVTRAEKDLAKVEELFYKRNSVTLEHAIAKETRGDYERFLLTILGKLHH
ncbi:annexin-like protein RJ4 [Silene latifolia]|uniref:annexin-like protein RJ4 n=1 Tax=Silene latifolia TaxID=37657 RepID=UPI003D77EDEB